MYAIVIFLQQFFSQTVLFKLTKNYKIYDLKTGKFILKATTIFTFLYKNIQNYYNIYTYLLLRFLFFCVFNQPYQKYNKVLSFAHVFLVFIITNNFLSLFRKLYSIFLGCHHIIFLFVIVFIVAIQLEYYYNIIPLMLAFLYGFHMLNRTFYLEYYTKKYLFE